MLSADRDNASKIAANIDFRMVFPFRRNRDRLKHGMQDLACLETRAFVHTQDSCVQPIELSMIMNRHVWVQYRRRRLAQFQLALEIFLPRFKSNHLGIDLLCGTASQDQIVDCC
ncbi:hypothetical protein [Sphingomonas bisphenolicum]|uniref:hypothetical protein n=1 Tax=Sphingomonas bisphenolicum TaxID=296544 RepID=UPI0021C3875F|nr:hypothetical protein [Sphingomonas bisphenolicum]